MDTLEILIIRKAKIEMVIQLMDELKKLRSKEKDTKRQIGYLDCLSDVLTLLNNTKII